MMMRFGRMTAAVLALAAAGIMSGPQPAAAEESGTVSMVSSATADYTTIEHAGSKVTGGEFAGTAFVVRSSGAPFLEGADFLLTCVVYAVIGKAGTDLRSPCTVTDAAGDNLFWISQRDAGDLEEGGGGGGRSELAGGTGKYAGIGGECSYETEYRLDNRAISKMECAWQR